MKTLVFDMDGTIADLYGVENWLQKIRLEDPTPYMVAEPMYDTRMLNRLLELLKAQGWRIVVTTWLAKGSTKDYDKRVIKAKTEWLAKHLKSVEFDEINIVAYGTPKSTVVSIANGILFDDEEPNRKEWKGKAYDETDIIGVLKALL
jgi:hypothetical protein